MRLIRPDSVFKNFDTAILLYVRIALSANIYTTLMFNDTIRNLEQGLKSQIEIINLCFLER